MRRPAIRPNGAPPNALVEEDVDIDSLVDNPRNPQVHPEAQITRLMASLTKRGQYKPVLARRENRMLIAGHGIRLAAQRLGWPNIRVAFWDVDQDMADRTMLGDNRLGAISTSDEERVAELLREIPESDWLSVGFSDTEAVKLLELDVEDIQVQEIDTTTVRDTFWISVRGPLEDQALALARLKVLLAEMPAVTVVLGTTDDLL